ncbi:AraC family transcriptional regulator N-terminal domain-containing protein [Streptomyces sp. NPDC127079]|uniref:AraC family transcriptional regulator N-terminal domain-containing protein n=1 Tax=Streptomyces sp. NPDC127079 TaxID=3347132 RepID=UPI003662B1B2
MGAADGFGAGLVDLPVTIELEQVPYRSAVLHIDDQAFAEMLVDMDDTTPAAPSSAGGQVCAPMTPELVDAVTR